MDMHELAKYLYGKKVLIISLGKNWNQHTYDILLTVERYAKYHEMLESSLNCAFCR